jgi:hypothetical protein
MYDVNCHDVFWHRYVNFLAHLVTKIVRSYNMTEIAILEIVMTILVNTSGILRHYNNCQPVPKGVIAVVLYDLSEIFFRIF